MKTRAVINILSQFLLYVHLFMFVTTFFGYMKNVILHENEQISVLKYFGRMSIKKAERKK